LELAETNASFNNVNERINFSQHNVLTDPVESITPVDLIVSNPPYVSLEEYDNLGDEIRLFEPRFALTDDSAGLNFYEKIFSLIENDHTCKFILVELSGTQPEEIIKITKKYNFSDVQVFEDLNNHPRILQLKIG